MPPLPSLSPSSPRAAQDPIHGFREFRESQKRDLAKADTWLRDHERKLDNDRRDKANAEREIEMARASFSLSLYLSPAAPC